MNENNRALHDLGQSLWVDNITRSMLDDGTLDRYIDDFSVTGLTSNPTIFDKAIAGGSDYDAQIGELAAAGHDPEQIFFELAMTDLRRAADLFADTHARTDRVDGFVSLEVSPLLADDTAATIEQAIDLHARAGRENLFIKIPGTEAGLPAIEEVIFSGVPVNVTLLFSRAVPRRRRRLHEGHRTPDRGRTRSGHRLGRLAVRQSVGRRGDRRGPGRVEGEARGCDRPADLRRLPGGDRR